MRGLFKKVNQTRMTREQMHVWRFPNCSTFRWEQNQKGKVETIGLLNHNYQEKKLS